MTECFRFEDASLIEDVKKIIEENYGELFTCDISIKDNMYSVNLEYKWENSSNKELDTDVRDEVATFCIKTIQMQKMQKMQNK